MKKFKSLAVWIILVTVTLVLYQRMASDDSPSAVVKLEAFLEDVREGRVESVRMDQGNEWTVQLRPPGGSYTTFAVLDEDLYRELTENGVHMDWGSDLGLFATSLPYLIPLLAVAGLFLFLYRKGGHGAKNVLNLTKSPVKVLAEERLATFAEVGGCQTAKEELRDVIDFLKDPRPWIASGARLPRGILLEGPPGCGKTLLARALAGETKAKFFSICASEFVEMFVGVGPARVRDTFEKASKQAPAVVFIDELDAVGRRRGSGVGPGHDEREQTINQLLVCLDGLQRDDRLVVLAATNRPDILDKALLRPGRFDRRINVPALGAEDRLSVLQVHTRNKRLEADVSLQWVADSTAGLTGADLETLANEAALLAVRRASKNGGPPAALSNLDFEAAMARLLHRDGRFNRVDSVLIESATQLAEPGGRAEVEFLLKDGERLRGEVVWADSTFVKLNRFDGAGEIVVAKSQVAAVETLEGTERLPASEVACDPWAGRSVEVA